MKHNIKIMKTKPEITDEEIQGYMNFEGLMKELKSKPKKQKVSTSAKIISLIGGVAIIAFVSYYIGKNNQGKPEERLPQKSDSENNASAGETFFKRISTCVPLPNCCFRLLINWWLKSFRFKLSTVVILFTLFFVRKNMGKNTPISRQILFLLRGLFLFWSQQFINNCFQNIQTTLQIFVWND